MKQLFFVFLILSTSILWGQNPPPGPKNGPGMGPGGPNLVDQGFTEAEAKAVEADLKAWQQSMREWDADLQVIDAQRNRLMIRDKIDKGELEKYLRAAFDVQLKRELAMADLQNKWRGSYGLEKARVVEGMLMPQDQKGGKKGQAGGPGGPEGPEGGMMEPGAGPGSPQKPKKP